MSSDDHSKNASKRTLEQLTRPDALLMASAWATAIRRRETIFVHAYYQKERGWLIGTSPYIILASAAPPDEVGRAVRTALDDTSRAEKPVDGRPATEATYEALGVRSQRELATDARCVAIATLEGSLVVVPTENRGEERAWNFEHLHHKRIVIPDGAADAEIGEAIKAGWERCS